MVNWLTEILEAGKGRPIVAIVAIVALVLLAVMVVGCSGTIKEIECDVAKRLCKPSELSLSNQPTQLLLDQNSLEQLSDALKKHSSNVPPPHELEEEWK